MSELKDVIIPIAIALLTAIISVYFSIKLKFAETEEKAFADVKLLISRLTVAAFIVWLAYDLIHRGISVEPIGRPEILLMILDGLSIALALGFFFVNKLLNTNQRLIELHSKQIEHAQMTNSVLKDHKEAINQIRTESALELDR